MLDCQVVDNLELRKTNSQQLCRQTHPRSSQVRSEFWTMETDVHPWRSALVRLESQDNLKVSG
jgi:hypothetical protein